MKKKSVGLVSFIMLLSYLLMPVTALANDKAFCSDNDVSKSEKTIEKTDVREEKKITLKAKQGELVKEKVDYELLIDASGSMKAERTDENGQEVVSIVEIKKAIKGFLEGLDKETDRVGVSVFRGPGYDVTNDTVVYGKSVTTLSEYTYDFDKIMTQVEAVEAGGLTPLLDGMNHSLNNIKNASREEARKVLVIFTDGHPNVGPERDYVVEKLNVYGTEGEYINIPGVHYPGSREIIDALREKSMKQDNIEEADKIEAEISEIESKYPLGAKLPISGTTRHRLLKGQVYDNHLQEFYDLMYLIDGKANEIKQNNIEIFTIFLDNTDSDVNYKKVSANGEVEALFGRIAQDDAHYIRTADAKGLQSKFTEVSDNVKRYNFELCDTVEEGFTLVPDSFEFSNEETEVKVDKDALSWVTTGTPEKEITVSYRIVKVKGKVIVHHVDTEGNVLAENVELTGKVEADYTTEKATIEGYTLTDVPSNATGTFKEEIQEVTYVYTKEVPTPKEGKVIVHHVDTEGNVLAENVELIGKVEADYTTEKATIEGYTLTDVPSNATGTFKEEMQEVTYVYTKEVPTPKEGKVIVHHVDTEGNVLAENVELTGKVEADYTTEKATIEGYTLTDVPSNATGTFKEEIQEVTYVYTKDMPTPKEGKVIVHHVDTEGKELSANVELNGEVETSFTTEKAEIKDYTLTEVPVNATGTFTEEVQEVTYVYTKDVPTPKEGKVIVYYVDTEGNALAKIVELSGEVEAAYNTEAKEIPGYGLVTTPDNKTGVFTENTQDVTYVYSKDEETTLPELKEGTVIVKYQDEEGNSLAEITTLTDKIETDYTTESKEIDGYTLKEVPINAQGVFTEEEQTVVYIYSKNVIETPDPIIETGTVVTHYVDTKGNVLSEMETLSGNVTSSYETSLKEIPGYTFVNVTGHTTGVFTKEQQEVTYVYTKNEETILPDKETQGTVTVVYEDGSGRLIEPSVVTKGDIGTEYHVTPKEIPGYVLKETKGKEHGTYAKENQTVTYVYEKEVNKVSTTPSSTKGHSTQQLPKTGEEANGMYYIVGLGLLVVVAVVGMKKVRRHK